MQTLTSFEALDRKLDECRAARAVSDDAMRGVFHGFSMAFALDQPVDPFSPEYRDFQMALYERVARRRYATANEATMFDVADAIRRPFPYLTGSTATAGQHLAAIGFLLQTLRLKPGARILEFGPGWGNTTLALARLGFSVTAVDVERRFCAVIAGQAAALGLSIETVNADFFYAEQVREPYDAVLFFECFHHCDDHMRLLRALRGAVVSGGSIYFAAEPILVEYPVPWGLRMDGEALWAIRESGWLELGFREAYFREALRRAGWIARRRVSADLPWISVFEATALPDGPMIFTASDGRLGSITGRKIEGAIRVENSARGYGLFGPHVPLAPGRYRGTLRFAPGAAVTGALTMDAGADRGLTVLGAVALDNAAVRRDGIGVLEFSLDAFKDEVELRLFCEAGATATVVGLEIVALDR